MQGTLFPYIKVGMQKVNLTPTVNIVNGEKVTTPNAPVYIYDTSGPFSDPNMEIDLKKGLPRMRESWIIGRGDVEKLPSITSEYGKMRRDDKSLDHLRFEHIALPYRAKAGKAITQMAYAKAGIVTPEMEYVAIRENMNCRELGIDTYAVNWPIGCGKEFQGVYDREKQCIIHFTDAGHAKKADVTEIALDDPALVDLIGQKRRDNLADEIELLGAGREFDLDAVRNGTLSPVFFGSALTNFGVEPFLNAFLEMTTPPLPRVSDAGEVDVYSPEFSAFVFKIQANMNKAHRDRLAFMRICSGKFERDTEYFHVQSGRKMRLSQPQQLMASEREIVDEAYAGDIIGVFDPGIFSIGDTITMPGKKFRFSGIPTFEPEHFMLVSPKDTMKRKQFVKGVEQIAQEGAIQIFKIPGAGLEEVIVGVVGTLQFDVFEYRMKNEYNVDLRMTSLPYDHLRLIESMDCHPDEIVLCTGSAVLQDFRDRYLVAFGGEWSVGFLTKHNPGLVLADTLSV